MGHIFLPYIAPTAAGPVTTATAYADVLNTGTDNSSFTATTSYTAAGGANNCLVALVAWDDVDPADLNETVLTYDGQTMTYVTGAFCPGADPLRYVSIFRLMNPPTTSNVNLSIKFYRSDGTTPATTSAVAAGLVELAGVNSSTPVGNTETLATDGTAIDPRMSFTPANDDSWVIYAYANGGGSGAGLPTTIDLTELANTSTGSGAYADIRFIFGEHDVGTAASLSLGHDTTSTSGFASCAAEFKP